MMIANTWSGRRQVELPPSQATVVFTALAQLQRVDELAVEWQEMGEVGS